MNGLQIITLVYLVSFLLIFIFYKIANEDDQKEFLLAVNNKRILPIFIFLAPLIIVIAMARLLLLITKNDNDGEDKNE